MIETVWVFKGLKAVFSSAVFHGKEEAVEWIRKYRLSGTLTEYPVGISVYDWVIREGKWSPSKPHQTSSDFIGRFSSAYQDHYHFEDGKSLPLDEDESDDSGSGVSANAG